MKETIEKMNETNSCFLDKHLARFIKKKELKSIKLEMKKKL